ncbi:MAG: hypothetical protein ACQETE_11605 [Bacteroidota bacterium]
MIRIRIYKLLLGLGFGMLIGAYGAGFADAVAQQYSYTGSAQFASGSYFFGETTQSFYLVNGMGWSNDTWNISLSIPMVVQNSPWVSYSTTGQLPTGGSQHGELLNPKNDDNQPVPEATTATPGVWVQQQKGSGRGGRKTIELPDTVSYTQAGFSDPSMNMGIQLWSSTGGRTLLNLNTTIKFPLTDPNNGFGTGKWDFGAGASIMQRLGTVFLMGDLMYWWFGDMEDLELYNPLNYSLGLGKSFDYGTWMANVSFNGYTEIIEDYDPPMSIAAGIGYTVSDAVNLNGLVSYGLSESAADYTIGLGWSVNF